MTPGGIFHWVVVNRMQSAESLEQTFIDAPKMDFSAVLLDVFADLIQSTILLH